MADAEIRVIAFVGFICHFNLADIGAGRPFLAPVQQGGQIDFGTFHDGFDNR
jgi:hypothetical protein